MFLDGSGFSKRVESEIKALPASEPIIILCRGLSDSSKNIQVGEKHVIVETYKTTYKDIEKPQKYIPFYYEVIRNAKLLFSFTVKLKRILSKNKISKVYVVNSPLTIPLFTLILCKLNKIRPWVVEFHDLEPELAIHIKNLKKNDLILKIELFLEKIVSNNFDYVIVTSGSQKKRLISRLPNSKSKIKILSNYISVFNGEYNYKENFSKNFTIGYLSTLSFGFTVNGLKKLIECYKDKIISKEILFKIIGGGPAEKELKNFIKNSGLETKFLVIGNTSNVDKELSTCNIAIIPWEKDAMTITQLPTKLFDYINYGIPIIYPNFPEFIQILGNKKYGLSYNKLDEIPQLIGMLTSKVLWRKYKKNLFLLKKSKYNYMEIQERTTKMLESLK